MILEPEITIESVYQTLIDKIRAYFAGAGMTKAVIGLSGGVSTVSATPWRRTR